MATNLRRSTRSRKPVLPEEPTETEPPVKKKPATKKTTKKPAAKPTAEPAAKKAKTTNAKSTAATKKKAPPKKPPTTSTAKAPPGTPQKSKSATPAAVVTPPKAPAGGKTKTSHPVDPEIRIKGKNPSDYTVYQDESNGKWYDAVLNQCNIGNNNNKYYRLQLLQSNTDASSFFTWFKWGRVGEPGKGGSTTWSGPVNLAAAKKTFGKKYQDKSGNSFTADKFVEKTGKYVPVEIDNDVEVDEEFMDGALPSAPQAASITYRDSTLDPTTQELVQVLFSKDMQSQALQEYSIDLKKLPLGVPSQQQIQRGIDVLNRIEEKLNNGNVTESYMALSSRFYTAIPHSFGRRTPPTIATQENLQLRFDMCNVLLDMYDTNETVRRISKEREKQTSEIRPNPIDEHYQSLKAELTLLDTKGEDFKSIQEYFDLTKSQGSKSKLINVWSVNREGEAERFSRFKDVGNRRLLWHGTNIAVVAPILTSGLRIMPHSGGRVGAGIYLANMQQKSAQYTRGYGAKFACMFLCEAPLGKQHIVNEDGYHASGLKKAPDGFDSVHAVGSFAPPSTKTMTIDGNSVDVAASMPENNGTTSSFHHDEFLCYDEAQVRLRYVLTVKL